MAKVARGVAFPPINLCYLGAIAQKAGHTVQIIDGEAEQLSCLEMLKRVRDFDPDLIGMTATTSFFDTVSDYAKIFKSELSSKIVVGGPHITYFKEQVFYSWFDYFVIGHCENTFASFLKAPHKTPGIIYREHGKPVFTGNALGTPNLNALPCPLRASLRHERYQMHIRGRLKRYTAMMMSRGCPFKCVFCSTSIYGNKVTKRSVDSVIEEIQDILSMGIEHIYFTDDTLTLDRQFILDVCKAILHYNLKFTWESSTRANLVDSGLLGTMREAGCVRLSFGLESADEGVRDIIRKNVPLSAYKRANRLTNRHDIDTVNSVMLGLPGDTRETIHKTIEYVRECREIKHATFGIAIPYPGSEMWDMAVKGEHGLKLLTKDFSKYQRYGSAVMEVNGMKPQELLDLQKYGLMRIYFVWWRILPVIQRFGIKALIKPFFSSLWGVIKKLDK